MKTNLIQIIMKNLLYSLVFILITSFGFANNSNEKPIEKTLNNQIELNNVEIVNTSYQVDGCRLFIIYRYEDGSEVNQTILLIDGVDCSVFFAMLAVAF